MIKGKIVEGGNFSKQIGVALFNVIAISPNLEEMKELFPNSKVDKEPNYITEKSDEKGDYVISNIVIHVKDERGVSSRTNIMLNNRQRISKEGKFQYINNVGNTVWAANEDELKSLATVSRNPKEGYRKYVSEFLKRPYRIALGGEEQMYDFIQKFTRIDTRDPEAELIYDTKKLLQGNFKELQKDLVCNDYKDTQVLGCYEIVSKKIPAHVDEASGEMIPETWSHFQGIYNRFLPAFNITAFDPKKTVYPKYVQDWYNQLVGENGSKNFFAKKVDGKYIIELARDYNESENPLNSDPTTLHQDSNVNNNNPSGPGTVDDLPF